MLGLVIAVMAASVGSAAFAAEGFRFALIDGGEISLDDRRGKPVLVVNTASLCGFVGQLDGLQAFHDKFGAEGALVHAVPSDDFNQELAAEASVKEHCALAFDPTLPMTEITSVRGQSAHPFHAWVKAETGFLPGWNFHKVLITPDGTLVGTCGSGRRPESAAIAGQTEAIPE
ncbi:MAG: glutathione peroxidase [Rhodobacter sp.]|nr:glutathione peroxidase [Rhodobacter sp.]